MKCWLAVLLSIAMTDFVLYADVAPFRFVKAITLATIDSEELAAVTLDSDVYAATNDDLSDMRLLTSEGTEVDYLVRKAPMMQTRTVRQTWQPEEIALVPRDGGLEITFQIDTLKQPHPPQGIRFESPLENFEHHVRIDTSSDGRDWQPLVADGLIFDYSQFMDVRKLDFELPTEEAVPHKHYRITIDDVTQEQQSQLLELTRDLRAGEELGRTERLTIRRQPFRIDRIELWSDVDRADLIKDRETAFPLSGFREAEDNKAKETHVTVDSRREPLTAFTVVTDDRNFSRSARVEVQENFGGRSEWYAIGSATIVNLGFRALSRKQLDVSFPETRAGIYRLVIENRDSPPLDVTTIEARGPVHEVVFLAAPQTEYRLAYGNADVTAPRYDTAAVIESLREGYQPIVAELGQEKVLTETIEPGKPLGVRMLSNVWFLRTLIGTLVLLLAWGLYHATRRLDQLPRSDTSDPASP